MRPWFALRKWYSCVIRIGITHEGVGSYSNEQKKTDYFAKWLFSPHIYLAPNWFGYLVGELPYLPEYLCRVRCNQPGNRSYARTSHIFKPTGRIIRDLNAKKAITNLKSSLLHRNFAKWLLSICCTLMFSAYTLLTQKWFCRFFILIYMYLPNRWANIAWWGCCVDLCLQLKNIRVMIIFVSFYVGNKEVGPLRKFKMNTVRSTKIVTAKLFVWYLYSTFEEKNTHAQNNVK